MNMGQVYLRLIETGNVLFKNWTATIYCDPKSQHTIRVNFGLNCGNIFDRREKEVKTINSLNKTIKFLQSSYDEWLAHITQKRDQFPCLNFFQISQIVMLRTQMAKLIRHEKHSEYRGIFDLLHNINKKTSVELLQEANSYVFNLEQNSFVEKAQESGPENIAASGDSELDPNVQKQLEELGFSRYISDLVWSRDSKVFALRIKLLMESNGKMDRFHFSLFKFKSFYHEICKQRNKIWVKIVLINGLF